MKISDRPLRSCGLAVTVSLLLVACQSTGGSFLLFGGSGGHQDDLIGGVQRARAEAVEAHQDFTAAFDLFRRETAPQAVDLEELNEDFEDATGACQKRAEELRKRIQAIRGDSNELFAEWKAELGHFSSEAMRKKSETMMADTEKRTQRVIAALERVQSKMEPVLLKLQDYSLFFNHNLNPRAIATLEDTYDDFDDEVKALTQELEKAQEELGAFLVSMEGRATEK